MEDHALYRVSSQIDVLKHVMSMGCDRRLSSASRAKNICDMTIMS